tara:strand:+ start:186 stop:305 length:120 start_codon:yes stop_codon:yes gene_type:complete
MNTTKIEVIFINSSDTKEPAINDAGNNTTNKLEILNIKL